MPTFRYTGPTDELLVRDPESKENVCLKKGEPFPTDSEKLAARLREEAAVEEVKDMKAAEPKRSRGSNGEP